MHYIVCLLYWLIFDLIKPDLYMIFWSPLYLPSSLGMLALNIIYLVIAIKILMKSNQLQFPTILIRKKNSTANISFLVIAVLLFLWISRLVIFVYFLTFEKTGYYSLFMAIYDAVLITLTFLFLNLSLYIIFIAPIIFKYKSQDLFEFPDKNETTLIKENLVRLLTEQKIYQNSEISLSSVASILNIKPRYLSHIVNNEMNQTFTDLINIYRINESKRLLIRNQDYTIQQIMFEVGFNSKSVFNTLFRKLTGTTPKQFRQNPH